MTYFPQLSSGATGQFPLRWTDSCRAVTNVLEDGGTISLADPNGAGAEWLLSFNGLGEGERAALQTFFESMRGPLKPFTVLDPADNLLAFSEDFTQSCWSAGPLLRITGGEADPFGRMLASTATNTAQAAQAISQQINAPGEYRYCFSVYVRSKLPLTLWLTQSCNGSVIRQPVNASATWQRAGVQGAVGAGDAVSFGIELASGAEVQIFGAQAEAQPAPGIYKRTGSTGGVYQNCRFDQNELQMTATASGAYRCALRIRSAGRVAWRA
jgi:hypothetical protein